MVNKDKEEDKAVFTKEEAFKIWKNPEYGMSFFALRNFEDFWKMCEKFNNMSKEEKYKMLKSVIEKWEKADKDIKKENESEDIKAFRKEIETRLLEVIDDYRQNWNKELAEKIEKMKKDEIFNSPLTFAGVDGQVLSNINEKAKGYNQAIKEILELLK